MSFSPFSRRVARRVARRATQLVVVATAMLAAALAPRTAAAQTASQVVSFEVTAINQLSVSGNPAALVINTANAGDAPSSVTSSTTTWAVTTNETSKKVTASLNNAMPSGTTLAVSLGAPGSASSAGATPLGTSAVDVVTGLSKLNANGLSVSYTLSATAAAGIVAATSRTVTFTLVAGP